MVWIGHRQAQRTLTENGWVYEDADNTALGLDLWRHNVFLPDVDDAIERLEAEAEKEKLAVRQAKRVAAAAGDARKNWPKRHIGAGLSLRRSRREMRKAWVAGDEAIWRRIGERLLQQVSFIDSHRPRGERSKIANRKRAQNIYVTVLNALVRDEKSREAARQKKGLDTPPLPVKTFVHSAAKRFGVSDGTAWNDYCRCKKEFTGTKHSKN